MNDNRNEAHRQVARLADMLVREIDQVTDEEVLQEAEEDYGVPDDAVRATRSVIREAISAHGKRRLVAARRGYEAQSSGRSLNVFGLPAERKRDLIDRFASNDNKLREKLTMAARNQEDLEADIDSFIEDLIELGVIDAEGNVL